MVIFIGDFKQILHVIPRDTRGDIVHSTINACIFGIIAKSQDLERICAYKVVQYHRQAMK